MTSSRPALLEACAALILITSAVLFGGVYAWCYAGIAAAAFTLLFIFPEAVTDPKLTPAPPQLMVLGVLLYVVLQTFFLSKVPEVSKEHLLQWSSCLIIFLTVRKLGRGSVLRILVLTGVLGALISLYGIFETLTFREHVLWHSKEAHRGFVTGTYFNRNHYAGLMEMAIPLQLAYLIRSVSKRSLAQTMTFLILLIPSFAGLALSGARTAMTCLLLSALLLSLPLMRRFGEVSPLSRLFLPLLLGVSGLLWGWDTVSSRFSQAVFQLHSLEGRVAVWEQMAAILRDYGIRGAGLGTFGWIFPAYQPASLDYAWLHAHQDYLELAVEIGIPAAAVIVLAAGWLMVHVLTKACASDFSTYVLIWGCCAGLLSLSLHGLMDFNLALPGQTVVFFSVLAAALRLSDFERKASAVRGVGTDG